MLAIKTFDLALLCFFLPLFLFLLGVLLDIGFELRNPEEKSVLVQETYIILLTLRG